MTYVIGSVALFEVTLECLEIGHSRLAPLLEQLEASKSRPDALTGGPGAYVIRAGQKSFYTCDRRHSLLAASGVIQSARGAIPHIGNAPC